MIKIVNELKDVTGDCEIVTDSETIDCEYYRTTDGDILITCDEDVEGPCLITLDGNHELRGNIIENIFVK